ncbi:hypothetical protein SPRG_02313 [Saprolegnia parasitica CBS 223.65]|uniref:Uncharacterized protein n=1 Tax=Saprolegnia parasitica (strain CBS 223.65) TaxID=695850 RepID=A0A067CW61_SAPPC|nr:hypothetical protein SPRG_02313 [Saprolegnia parasitica CBS 223.65]KDO33505.1 hypothetical protein SPRG_02313 [Saprolegnia parasitica CBS 223.65]|eukprot:XP_012196248.1 hypothetical protein SPRG_02313 [Saprolegnia parasitica CBS 223.65]
MLPSGLQRLNLSHNGISSIPSTSDLSRNNELHERPQRVDISALHGMENPLQKLCPMFDKPSTSCLCVAWHIRRLLMRRPLLYEVFWEEPTVGDALPVLHRLLNFTKNVGRPPTPPIDRRLARRRMDGDANLTPNRRCCMSLISVTLVGLVWGVRRSSKETMWLHPETNNDDNSAFYEHVPHDLCLDPR